jgi:Mor family transcriptional regulator
MTEKTLRQVSKTITDRRNKIIMHQVIELGQCVKEVAKKHGLTTMNVYQILHRTKLSNKVK